MNNHAAEQFDVVVIGGGASGMMAAGRAAELGARVLLLEKNESLGKKLSITGGGRCNITNAKFDNIVLAEKFGKDGKFLLPALARFDVQSTIDFFSKLGLQVKEEAEQRMFPVSENAIDVRDTLVRYLNQYDVQVRCYASVLGFEVSDLKVMGVRVGNKIIHARNFILSTGGKSHPETGSTGDGFRWLREIGHTVNNPDLSLVPVTIHDAWVKSLQGISLANARLSIVYQGKKQKSSEGKMLFTHFGISGPLVLNMSRAIREYLESGSVELSLDIFPGQDMAILDENLQKILEENHKKQIKNTLHDFLPTAFVDPIIQLVGIDLEKVSHQISRSERLSIIEMAKNMRMTVSGFLHFDKAIVSSGGIKLSEIDFKTMRSRMYENLFITGDLLDINRPSGGYSLQICWTTGRIAGENAAK